MEKNISESDPLPHTLYKSKELNLLITRCSNISRISEEANEEGKKELRIAIDRLETKFGVQIDKPINGSITRFVERSNWVTVIGNTKTTKIKGRGINTGRLGKADSRYKSYREILIPKIKCYGKCRQPDNNSRNCNVDKEDRQGSQCIIEAQVWNISFLILGTYFLVQENG